MAAKKKTGSSNKDTSKMPKTKKYLGAADAGEAQRIGGLRQAGNFFSGSDQKHGGKALEKAYGSFRVKHLKQDVIKKSSKGGGKMPKK